MKGKCYECGKYKHLTYSLHDYDVDYQWWLCSPTCLLIFASELTEPSESEGFDSELCNFKNIHRVDYSDGHQ